MSFQLESTAIDSANNQLKTIKQSIARLSMLALQSSLDGSFSTVSGLDSTGLTNGLALKGTSASAQSILRALEGTLDGSASNLQALTDGATTTDTSYSQGFNVLDDGGTGAISSPFLAQGFSGIEASPIYKQLPVIPMPSSLLALEGQMAGTFIGQAADANHTWGKVISGLSEATAEIHRAANTVQAAGYGASIDAAADSIRGTGNTAAVFTANAAAMRGHVDALWHAKLAMHGYVRQALDIVAAAGVLSPIHASQMDTALRAAYVPVANTALAPAQPIPVTLTSADAPAPGSIVDAGRNAVSVPAVLANAIDNVQWPNSARQELVNQIAQQPGQFSTAEQAAELVDTLHPHSGSVISPDQLATAGASTQALTAPPQVPGGMATTGALGTGQPTSLSAPGNVLGGVGGPATPRAASAGTAGSPGASTSLGGRAGGPGMGAAPLGGAMGMPSAARSGGSMSGRPGAPGFGAMPGSGTSGSGMSGGTPGSNASGRAGALPGGMAGGAIPGGGARLSGSDDGTSNGSRQSGAHSGARNAGGFGGSGGAGASPHGAPSSHGAASSNGAQGRSGMMMGAPMAGGGAGGRGGQRSDSPGAKAVTSQVERAGNLQDLLGDRPAVVPGVIGSWVFDRPDTRP